jgi:hypothetical protein
MLNGHKDNQRRSRARRQEHLADLEKRLTDSHATNREAEILQAAFRDAQTENTRLRDLLKVAGVNEALIRLYVDQDINRSSTVDPGHRTIRPRIAMQREDIWRSERTRAVDYPELLAISKRDVEPDWSQLGLLSTSLSLLLSRLFPGAFDATSSAPGYAHVALLYFQDSFTTSR